MRKFRLLWNALLFQVILCLANALDRSDRLRKRASPSTSNRIDNDAHNSEEESPYHTNEGMKSLHRKTSYASDTFGPIYGASFEKIDDMMAYGFGENFYDEFGSAAGQKLADEDIFDEVAAFVADATTSSMNYVTSMDIKENGNYQVPLVFQYECDPSIPDEDPDFNSNLEKALINYHTHVSDQLNQGLSGIGVSFVNNTKSACVTNRRGRRGLLRSLRYRYVLYNFFSGCIGFCPSQLLPFIPTPNRRRLEIDLLQDKVPFLDQFISILKQDVGLVVTQSTTNSEQTNKIDCSDPNKCYNQDGLCCGQSDCNCKFTSESLCTIKSCDLPGGDCCTTRAFCSQEQACTCFSSKCESDQCCDQDLSLCSGLCRAPTSFPTSTPTPAPTSLPSISPIRNPPMIPSKMPSKTPSKTPSATPSTFIHPSMRPTSTPTGIPTTSPSRMPSTFTHPSTSPTSTPSSMPTMGPSTMPSTFTHPSTSPTSTPSSMPTMGPSTMPSTFIHPSTSPTSTPSSMPTMDPSTMPSTFTHPSTSPSSTPSSMPTMGPSTMPSSNPPRQFHWKLMRDEIGEPGSFTGASVSLSGNGIIAFYGKPGFNNGSGAVNSFTVLPSATSSTGKSRSNELPLSDDAPLFRRGLGESHEMIQENPSYLSSNSYEGQSHIQINFGKSVAVSQNHSIYVIGTNFYVYHPFIDGSLMGSGRVDTNFADFIALSANGTVLAISEMQNVTIYDIDKTTRSYSLKSTFKDDDIPTFGKRLAMSKNAAIVAISGSSLQQGVMMYEWNGTHYDFLQQINREGCRVLQTNVSTVFSMAFSYDGSTFVIGDPVCQRNSTKYGTVNVYVRTAQGSYEKREVLGPTDAPQFFGYSTALSADGETLVVGSDSVGFTVQVFHFDGEWTQRGSSLQGGQSVSIDISYDGQNVLIGSKEFSDGGTLDNGRVAYYRWEALSPTPPPTAAPTGLTEECNENNETKVEVEIFTDAFPSDTSWKFLDSNNNIVADGGNYTDPYALITSGGCIQADECHRFIIYDSFGDGLSVGYGGNYTLLVDNAIVGFGRNFTFNETVLVNCD